MDIDFNLENYDLNDILNLFSLDYYFNKEDLKKAKRIVLQTHPDKSRLDKKYFLFFSAAYKILYQIFEFRYKSQQCVSRNRDDTSELKYTAIESSEHEHLIEKIKNKKNFNKWFNDLFEKTKIKDDENDNGYGSWLKENDQDDQETDYIVTKDTMNEAFEKKKKILRDKSIIVSNDISVIDSGSGHFDIGREKVENYSSSVFSRLKYEDLKKAHTETVVPVTNEDYINKKKFNSVNEMQKFRSSQNTKALSEETSMEMLNNNRMMDDKRSVQRAYRLAKQDEMSRKSNDLWWSTLKQLTNN